MAIAAPATPKLKVYINNGSNPILRTAPNNKAHIVVFAAPSLVTILFIVTLKTLKMQETM